MIEQFGLSDTTMELSTKAKILSDKAAHIVQISHIEKSQTFDTIFGLDEIATQKLENQIERELKHTTLLEDLNIKIQDLTISGQNPVRLARLEARKTAILAQKISKFDNMKSQVSVNLQKKFQLEKMTAQFKNDIESRKFDAQINQKKQKAPTKMKINKFEMDLLGENAEILLKNDLTFDSIARSKIYNSGNLPHLFSNNRDIRKIVLSSDISNLSEIEENFNERDYRISAGEMKPRKNHPGSEKSSDAVSEFDSKASRVNFWKDINTKDEEYEGAVFVAKDDLKKNKGSQEKKKAKRDNETEQLQNDKAMLNQKIYQMRTDFELAKVNIKKQSLDYAVNYFQDKSLEMSALYTGETMKLLNHYTLIKNDATFKQKSLKTATKVMAQQELVISELRQFIQTNLIPIMELIEQERDGIFRKYQDIGEKIPVDDTDDPLKTFGYKCGSCAIKTDNELEKQKKEILKLRLELRQKQDELDSFHQVTEMLVKDGEQMQQKNQQLMGQNEEIAKQLEEIRLKYNEDIQERDNKIKEQQISFTRKISNLSQLSKMEQKVSLQIQLQLNNQIKDLKNKLKQIRHVIRTPRLNQFYRNLMIQSEKKDTFEEYMTKIDIDISESEADEALRVALELTIGAEEKVDELMKETNYKKLIKTRELEKIYNVDNLKNLNINNYLKSQRQIQNEFLECKVQESRNPLSDINAIFSAPKSCKNSKMDPRYFSKQVSPRDSLDLTNFSSSRQQQEIFMPINNKRPKTGTKKFSNFISLPSSPKIQPSSPKIYIKIPTSDCTIDNSMNSLNGQIKKVQPYSPEIKSPNLTKRKYWAKIQK